MVTVSGYLIFMILTHSETISEILQLCVTSRKTESYTLTHTGVTGGHTHILVSASSQQFQ